MKGLIMKIRLTGALLKLAAFTAIIFIFFAWRISLQPGSHNDISRLAGTISAVRFSELHIDNTVQVYSTVDKVFYNGKFYSSKPPVLNWTLGVVIGNGFNLLKPVLLQNDVAIYRVATMLAVVLPLLGIFLLFKQLKGYKWAFFLIFGTLLFSYSRHLNNHVLEAFIQLAIFYLLFFDNRVRNFSKQIFLLLIGFLLSALTVIDLTYAFIAVPVTGFFIITRFNYKQILIILLGSLPLLILHFALSYIQFRTFLPPQMMPEIYLNYPGSNWINNTTGIEGQSHSYPMRFFNYLFGTYGFFLYQPLLLLPVFIKSNWRKSSWIYVVAIFIGYTIFSVITTPNYGGSSFGSRRFLPLIPLFLYFVTNIKLREYSKKLLFIILLLLTAFVSYLGYINTWGNWDYYMGIDETKDFYFPLLYTIRDVLRRYRLDWLLTGIGL